jgi:hypothetical protein
MTGTFINTGAVLAGGTLGSVLGARFPDRMHTTIMHVIGIFTLAVGVSLFLDAGNVLVVLGSLVIGGIAGEALGLEAGLLALGEGLKARCAGIPFLARGDFTRGFVTAGLVFCVGPMTVVGSMQDGLHGDPSLLVIKSVLDFFAGMAFAAGMGMGVTFAALIVLVVQGSLTLGASALSGILSESMTADMSATGGIILLGLGLRLLEIKSVRAANLLPGLVFAPVLSFLAGTL